LAGLGVVSSESLSSASLALSVSLAAMMTATCELSPLVSRLVTATAAWRPSLVEQSLDPLARVVDVEDLLGDRVHRLLLVALGPDEGREVDEAVLGRDLRRIGVLAPAAAPATAGDDERREGEDECGHRHERAAQDRASGR
jgi:hypothetical protein